MENLFFSVNIKEEDSMKKWIALLLSLVMVMSVMNIAAAQVEETPEEAIAKVVAILRESSLL